MLIDVTKPLTETGFVQDYSLACDIESLEYQGNKAVISWTKDVSVKAENVNRNEALLTVVAEAKMVLPCDRCLKDVETVIQVECKHSVFSEEPEKEPEDDEYTIGKEIDIKPILEKELFINWPDKVLCKDDCKGLCSKCGADLNLGDCGCDTFVPDPRWSQLADLKL